MKAAGERPPQSEKKPKRRPLPGKAMVVLCMASFFMGLLFSNRRMVLPLETRVQRTSTTQESKISLIAHDCEHKHVCFLVVQCI